MYQDAHDRHMDPNGYGKRYQKVGSPHMMQSLALEILENEPTDSIAPSRIIQVSKSLEKLYMSMRLIYTSSKLDATAEGLETLKQHPLVTKRINDVYTWAGFADEMKVNNAIKVLFVSLSAKNRSSTPKGYSKRYEKMESSAHMIQSMALEILENEPTDGIASNRTIQVSKSLEKLYSSMQRIFNSSKLDATLESLEALKQHPLVTKRINDVYEKAGFAEVARVNDAIELLFSSIIQKNKSSPSR